MRTEKSEFLLLNRILILFILYLVSSTQVKSKLILFFLHFL